MLTYNVLLITFVLSLIVSVGSATYLILWLSLPHQAKKDRGPTYLQILWIGSKIFMLAVGIASSGRSILLLRGDDVSYEYSTILRGLVWGTMAISIIASVTKLVWDLWATALQVRLEEMAMLQDFLDYSIRKAARKAARDVRNAEQKRDKEEKEDDLQEEENLQEEGKSLTRS